MLEFLNANANYATWGGLVVTIVSLIIAIRISKKSNRIDSDNNEMLKLIIGYVGEDYIKQKNIDVEHLKNGRIRIKVPAGDLICSGEPPSVSVTSDTIDKEKGQR